MRRPSTYEAEFSSYISALLPMGLAKSSMSGLRSRKSLGLLTQCESHRTGDGCAMTTVLKQCPLLFLNFTLGLATLDCIISMGKSTSDFSLRTTGRQCLLGWGHVSEPLVFLPWQMLCVHSVHLHLVDWEREACQDTHSRPLWHEGPRAGHERILCWIPHVQALLPNDN